MKKSLLSLFALAVMLTMFSCGNEDSDMTDTELIVAIQQANNKQDISVTVLPGAASTELTTDFSESYTEHTQLAPGLGYECRMVRRVGTRIGERNQVYFNLDGRRLRADRERPDRGEERPGDNGTDWKECFDLVYPVTYLMSDGTEITGANEEEVGTAIRVWYQNNPDSEEEPALQYPVGVVYENQSTLTVNSDEELRGAYEGCE